MEYNFYFGENIIGRDWRFTEKLFQVNDEDSDFGENDYGEPITKRSGIDLEVRRIYKQDYDLNKLVQKLESGQPIERRNLDLKDSRQLQYFLN